MMEIMGTYHSTLPLSHSSGREIADSLHSRRYPYGTCSAYTCEPPATPGQMEDDEDCWTFFWEEGYGKEEGEGAGCIKDPGTGECGCEDSDGTFIAGSDSCT